MSDSAASLELPLASPATRWIQLGLGLICMMAISSPQYVWTLFTKPLGGALGVSPAALAGDVLAADRAADVLLAVPGLAGGPLRSAHADRNRRGADRACPGCWPRRRLADDALSDLRRDRRARHRHRLCRRGRPDGGLVPRSARLCRRRGRRGLRHGRDRHHLPDRQFAGERPAIRRRCCGSA